MAANNPIASYYEAQAAATAEVMQAVFAGMQRIQQLTLQAMQAGTSADAASSAGRGARFQSELLQAIADMNNNIVRASYSMMERMRDVLGAGAQGAMSMASAFPLAGDASTNPMALYDAAMRQWQTTVQQMMDTPSVAMAVAGAVEDDALTARKSAAKRSSTSSRKRKSTRKH
ncbi:MAG: hypothetical protein ACRECQ_00925 [Burkholderiaceae bacterium]